MQFFFEVLIGGLLAGVMYFVYRSRAGLILRAVGESPSAAYAIGYPVIGIRYLASAGYDTMALSTMLASLAAQNQLDARTRPCNLATLRPRLRGPARTR